MLTCSASHSCDFAAKVLIVEDEFLLALQLQDILMDGGHDIVATLSEHAGLRGIGDRPDVALVDLNLRDGLTGPAIARDIAGMYGTPVIYVTANPGQIDIPASTAVGVLQKPYSREAVLAAVAYAMAQAQATHASRPAQLEDLAAVRV